MAKTKKKPSKKIVKTQRRAKKPAPAPAPPPEPPSYRELKNELGNEVTEFRDYLVTKYSDYHGHDMRKDVAWYLEQYGNGILSDIEKQKRLEREKIIAENRAKEEAERAAQEVAPK